MKSIILATVAASIGFAVSLAIPPAEARLRLRPKATVKAASDCVCRAAECSPTCRGDCTNCPISAEAVLPVEPVAAVPTPTPNKPGWVEHPETKTFRRAITQCQGGVCTIIGYEEVPVPASVPSAATVQYAPAASSCGSGGCAPLAGFRPFGGLFRRR